VRDVQCCCQLSQRILPACLFKIISQISQPFNSIFLLKKRTSQILLTASTATAHRAQPAAVHHLSSLHVRARSWEAILRLSAFIDLYIHPLKGIFHPSHHKIYSFPVSIHHLYHPLFTVGLTCHFI
jgi:hypothetical protein